MGVWISICVVYIGVSLNAFRVHPISPELAKKGVFGPRDTPCSATQP